VDHPALLTPPRAVIFDFNGTISDDEPLLAELFEQIFGEVGIAVGRDLYFEEFAGYSDAEICERILARFGRSDDDGLTERLVARRTELYLERQKEQPTVTSEATDFVRRVAERVPVAVASGAARREIEAVLTAAGLRSLFDVLVCLEDVAEGKPHPAGYLLALDQLQRSVGERIDAADVLVFEDSEQGLRAALAAGMRCIVVSGTAPAGRLVGAAAIVDRLDWSIPMVEGWR
jgi:HAD superfamily hydrolase (TIGR01509 family)